MIAVAVTTSWMVIHSPKSRIIPIVLGIFGYTYGSLLGIFLLGVLTQNRGSDRGNLIAMFCGFVAVSLLSGLPNDVAKLFATQFYEQPTWLPVIEFPWRILFGSVFTFFIAICFRKNDFSKPNNATCG